MDVNVKIYKTATQKSILDVLSALDYHKENKNKELVYKGNIVFVINEYGASKKTERAYVSKVGAKILAYAIMNDKFSEFFPKGFTEYGGSLKDGKVIARVLSVQLTPRKQYVFTIEVGPGEKESNGAIKKIKTDVKVQSYISYEESLKLSHELYDFIHQTELVALMKKKPLYTILPEFKGTTNNDNSYVDDVVVHEENVDIVEPLPSNSPYVIQIGNWKGMLITDLDTSILEAVINKMNPEGSPEKLEFINEAKNELHKRNQ